MLDWRTLGLGVLVFFATFAVGWWSGLGALLAPVGVSSANSSQQAAVETPAPALAKAAPVAAQPSQPGLFSEKLRQVVVLRSVAYRRASCDRSAKTLYINAATAYAETLMRASGCHKFPACGLSLDGLDRVWQANRGLGDQAVSEAMAAINSAGGVSARDFRGDVGRSIRVIANADFADGEFCVASNSQSSGSRRFRIRIRR